MTDVTFEAWPKIARLNRDCIITEKIDGTNAAVIVQGPFPFGTHVDGMPEGAALGFTEPADDGLFDTEWVVAAQSRTRLITPEDDNFGFARWVLENASELAAALGPGRHFGEWWGSGIQRGYGLPKGERRFSLFNVNRYAGVDFSNLPGVALVPKLYSGPFTTLAVDNIVSALKTLGSAAAPDFMRPEGVVVFHTAAQTVFKVTCEKDEAPKGQVSA